MKWLLILAIFIINGCSSLEHNRYRKYDIKCKSCELEMKLDFEKNNNILDLKGVQ